MPGLIPSIQRLRVVVLGGTGRLGACLVRHYEKRYDVLTPSRSELDLAEPEQCVKTLENQNFDVLINTAGMTSPDICEQQPEDAQRINAEAPAAIAALCHRKGARMIHISTDYVFEGNDDEVLSEDDACRPICIYGQTKLEGERGVLAADPSALVVRVSWLFGPDKASFPDSILNQAREGRPLWAIEDKWSTPTFIDHLALWLEWMFTKHKETAGVLHLSNSGMATWQEYAQATVDIAHSLGLLPSPLEVKGQLLDGFPLFKARRPRFTPLSNDRFTQITGVSPVSWQAALTEYLTLLKSTPG